MTYGTGDPFDTPTPEQLAANLRSDALILKDSKKLEDQLLSDVADTWAGRLEASLAARGPVVRVADLIQRVEVPGHGFYHTCIEPNCPWFKDASKERAHADDCVVGQALAAWEARDAT